MTKWEYKTLKIFLSVAVDHLNQMGKDGWELVTSHPGDFNNTMLYFKRPLPPEPITFDGVVSCTSSYVPVDFYAPPAVVEVVEVKGINEG